MRYKKLLLSLIIVVLMPTFCFGANNGFDDSFGTYYPYTYTSTGGTISSTSSMNDRDDSTFCIVNQDTAGAGVTLTISGVPAGYDRLYIKASEEIKYNIKDSSDRWGYDSSVTESLIQYGTTKAPMQILIKCDSQNFNMYEIGFYKSDSTKMAKIISSNPANNYVSVPIDTTVTMTADLNLNNFQDWSKIYIDGVECNNTVSGRVITLIPKNKLQFNTSYVVYVNSLRTKGGVNSNVPYSFTFTTQTDNLPVEVLSIEPPDMATDISLDTDIKVTFNKPYIDGNTINGITLKDDETGKLISTDKAIDGGVVTLSLNENLQASKVYRINIDGVSDTYGNNLYAPVTARFTTEFDSSALLLSSIRPPTGTTVATNQRIELQFNKPIKDGTLEYKLTDKAGNDVITNVQYQGEKVVLIPTLTGGKEYILNVINSTDIYGNALSSPTEITFKTLKSVGNADLDKILNTIFSIFLSLKNKGLVIVGLAISIGIIFVTARWLWRKLKQWLAKSK